MKRLCWVLGLLICLTGCEKEDPELRASVEFREKLLSAPGCSFSADVTADYGEELHTFSMDCRADAAGKLEFEITKPESIAGISGTITDTGGAIRFEEEALYFPLLTDDLLTPASAPWIFLKTLRSGYLTSVCREEEMLHLTVDDSFAQNALTLDIWLEEMRPVRADILHDGKRILSLTVENFAIL